MYSSKAYDGIYLVESHYTQDRKFQLWVFLRLVFIPSVSAVAEILPSATVSGQ